MKRTLIILIQLVTAILSISTSAFASMQVPINPMGFEVEMVPWEKVDKLIPRYAKFEVIDMETGLHFNVQRRAGKNHADVQPLSYNDTLIMKKIYDNRWSWKRRAIIVNLENQLIAASMHGMPHGAGAIKNGFPGHFCIHFYGSKLHKSRSVDLAHQIMIHRAAGKLQGYLDQFSPYELIDAFIIAMNQKDKELLSMILVHKNHIEKITEITNDIEIMRRTSEFVNHNYMENLFLTIPVEVNISTVDAKQVKRRIEFNLERKNLFDPWRLTITKY